MRTKAAAGWWLILGVLVGSAVGADELSLSHLVVQADSSSALVGIDADAVARFCGDADGCQIVLRLERATEGRTSSARLFFNAGGAKRWFSSATAGAYFVDADGDANQVVSLANGPNTCAVDDGDFFDPGVDNELGFELGVFGGAGATCTVIVSD